MVISATDPDSAAAHHIADIDPQQTEVHAEFESVCGMSGHAHVVQFGPGDAVVRIAVHIGESLAKIYGQVLRPWQAEFQPQRAVFFQAALDIQKRCRVEVYKQQRATA